MNDIRSDPRGSGNQPRRRQRCLRAQPSMRESEGSRTSSLRERMTPPVLMGGWRLSSLAGIGPVGAPAAEEDDMGENTWIGFAGPQDPIYGIRRANLIERSTEANWTAKPLVRKDG